MADPDFLNPNQSSGTAAQNAAGFRDIHGRVTQRVAIGVGLRPERHDQVGVQMPRLVPLDQAVFIDPGNVGSEAHRQCQLTPGATTADR